MKKVLSAITGDLTQTKCDAIVTDVNSGGMWFGGIDGAIQRVAGDAFHSQVRRMLPLKHGATVVAKNNGGKHQGAFSNAVFVIDDLQGPLNEIVYNGLKAASDAGFKSVCLPTIRMGVMLGVVEKSRDEAATEMIRGVGRFIDGNPNSSIEHITFVVYVDPETQELLQSNLKALPL
jgi:O-acetyl-ADP-ribose deacetylase (regulator of RNase III)